MKSIMLFGWGVASATREKIEEAVEEMIKRGEVASADRSKAIDELQQKAQAAASEIRKVVDERIEAVGKRLRWIDDLRKVQGEVDRLKARVDQLEKAGKATKAKK